MISNIFSNSTIPVVEQVAAFAEARHGLLVGNLANLDTPGYKTRDLSVDNFQARLQEAIEARNLPEEYRSPGVMGPKPEGSMREVKDTLKSILYHDQSDISLEQQVMELSNNQIMHNVAVAVMTQQYRQMQIAISERV